MLYRKYRILKMFVEYGIEKKKRQNSKIFTEVELHTVVQNWSPRLTIWVLSDSLFSTPQTSLQLILGITSLGEFRPTSLTKSLVKRFLFVLTAASPNYDTF